MGIMDDAKDMGDNTQNSSSDLSDEARRKIEQMRQEHKDSDDQDQPLPMS